MGLVLPRTVYPTTRRLTARQQYCAAVPVTVVDHPDLRLNSKKNQVGPSNTKPHGTAPLQPTNTPGLQKGHPARPGYSAACAAGSPWGQMDENNGDAQDIAGH